MSTGKVHSVWSVKYGERVVRKSVVFHDYAQYGLPDGDLDMDYNFWVIKAGSSVILMDTGYDIAARDWLGEISVTPTPEGLKLIGLDPLEVDMVITSHFHYDHIGYLGLFERAQVISGQKEYDYWFANVPPMRSKVSSRRRRTWSLSTRRRRKAVCGSYQVRRRFSLVLPFTRSVATVQARRLPCSKRTTARSSWPAMPPTSMSSSSMVGPSSLLRTWTRCATRFVLCTTSPRRVKRRSFPATMVGRASGSLPLLVRRAP